MKSILVIAVIFFSFFELNAQSSENKIYKRWIYLDKNWKQLTDTSNYVYKRLTTMDGNTNIHPMGPYGRSNYTLKKTADSVSTDSKILNGTYTWYDKSGNKKSEHVFVNGEYTIGKEFRKNGNVKKMFVLNTNPKVDLTAFYIYFYNKDMTVLEIDAIKKDENGAWPRMR